MGTFLTGIVWAFAVTTMLICLWQMFRTKPADVRRQLNRQGRLELGPWDWLGLALVLALLAGASGYAMATGWSGEYLDPLLAPLVRRF